MERSELENNHLLKDMIKRQYSNDLLGLFPIEDHWLNGVKVKRNGENNLCEFDSLDSFRKVFKTGATWIDKMASIPELSEEIKAEYPVWMECSEIITELYPVKGYMYLKDFPLVVVCEDRLFASTPVVEG